MLIAVSVSQGIPGSQAATNPESIASTPVDRLQALCSSSLQTRQIHRDHACVHACVQQATIGRVGTWRELGSVSCWVAAG